MKALHALGFVGFSVFSVRGQAALYGQCGGKGWTGATTCVAGAHCTHQNDYYWQCTSSNVTTSTSGGGATPTTPDDCAARSTTNEAPMYAQCGGKSWTGVTACVSGAVCTHQNDYYSQCLPGNVSTTATSAKTTPTTTTTNASSTSMATSAKTTPTTTTTNASSTSMATSAKTTPTTSTTNASSTSMTTSSHSTSSTGTSPTASSASSTPASSCGATPASAGKFKYAGMNIAGYDFGTDTNGDSTASAADPALIEYNGADGAGQMTHFVNDDKYNLFRLPVSWQFLTDDVATGTLNQVNFAKYDALVKASLATGASCIIDIHNYARWNGEIIGQGGPSNEVFAALWGSLASHYAREDKVLFGLMNEPHDLDITLWAKTVQAAVTAIRKAGANTQIILLSGDHYTSAFNFASGGAGASLSTVTNPDGSHTNLVFDVHRYLDSDGSGSSDTCVTDNIQATWEPFSQWLRCSGRQALVTETGGGNTASCEQYMCQQIHYLAKNSDVILGYVGWAAGSFSATYTLSETPTKNGNTWKDQALVTTCMAPSVNGYLD